MEIRITALCRNGCTDFVPQPRRLHLGGQGAEGVDTLEFLLPSDWADKNVSLYVEHADGVRQLPLLLGADGCVPVDRRFTGAASGRWMLAVTDGEGYTACTQPGSYDVYPTLSLDDEGEEPSQSLYEQFVAQVMDSARQVQEAVDQAVQSGSEAASAARDAAQAADKASNDRLAADSAADRAEEAARRAEGYVPEGGDVISVNGKGGAVWLEAEDVEALPYPENAAPGQLLRVETADPVTGRVTVEAVDETALTSFVRRTDLPSADQPGAVRLESGGGLALADGGLLETDPAAAAHLDVMTDERRPLTPSLLPYGVKKALSAAWESAGWTGDDQSAACSTLGAAPASALEALALRVQQLEENGPASSPTASSVPVGSIFYFAGGAVPEGYLLCDGSLVNRKTYSALFAVIGTTYGAGNASTTFALPNLMERVAWGAAEAGTELESGLPNITGQVYSLYTMMPWDSGAFTNYNVLSSYYPGFEGEYTSSAFNEKVVSFIEHNFRAASSNPIYGRTEHVQPPALTLLPCIKY